MTYRVYNTDQFEEDLNRALDYIEFSLHNPRAADDLFDEAARCTASLSQLPLRCAKVDDVFLAGLGIRVIRVKNYLAFYVVDTEVHAVHMLRFLYGRSDWCSVLRSGITDNPQKSVDPGGFFR